MDKLAAMAVFQAVAESGSLAAAATRLGQGRSSVAAALRQLEQQLGTALVQQEGRALTLTALGQVYLARARDVLASVDQAEADARRLGSELKGVLHLEVPISIGQALLCPLLPGFAARYPEIRTSVTLTNQPHHLIEREIDVAVRADRVEDEDLVARPIYEAPYVVCCTPELAATLPPDPTDLDPAQCLGLYAALRRRASPWRLTRDGRTLEIQPASSLHFNNSQSTVLAALQGAGVAHVLSVFVTRELAQGTLVPVYPQWQTARRTYYAVMPRHRAGAAKVRALVDHLTEALASERREVTSRPVKVKALGKR